VTCSGWSLGWLPNLGAGLFGAFESALENNSPVHGASALYTDLDLDGDVDIALARNHWADSFVDLWLNDGTSSFDNRIAIADTVDLSTLLLGADVDSDGYPDLVYGNAEDPITYCGR